MTATKSKKVATESKSTKAATNGKAEDSNRLRVFKALNSGRAHTDSSLRVAIGMAPANGQLGVILRGEIAAGRVKAVEEFRNGQEDQRGFNVYYLTAKGKKHLEAGKVDSWAVEKHLVAVGRGAKFGD